METYIGVDVGSVSTKFAVLDRNEQLIAAEYLYTRGNPISALQNGLSRLHKSLPSDVEIRGVATTGSARYLAGEILGADLIKNEITTHAVAALTYVPQAQTVVEIGGQDSKIIIIRDGVVTDFAMNTLCAAGTGSFLDHQALRLNMTISEFSDRALLSRNPVRIAGRCTVFAESDMIHKQQMGHATDDIIYGLCQALIRNYLNNVGLGKEICMPVVFQGGVAFNKGIIKALQDEIGEEVIVPPHHEVMGAIGAAILVREQNQKEQSETGFKGFSVTQREFLTSSFECRKCPNMCEIVKLAEENRVVALWGGRCDLWEHSLR